MTIDPHTAERMILIGCHDALSEVHTLRLHLHPHERDYWHEQAKSFLNDTVKYDSTTCAVFVEESYKDWPESDAIVKLTHEHYKQARINQNTVETIGAVQGRNFITNLARIVQQPYAFRDARTQLMAAMEGQTVIVCGAGPSIEQAHRLLNKHKGPVIAVNTSAGCVAQAGVRPIAVVCTESKAVREGIERMDAEASHFAMDLIGNPDNWLGEWTARKPQLVFVGTEPNLAPYARVLGLLPLAYGSSCTTAAVSLALACGAARVALVGQDCAFMPFAYRHEVHGQSAWPAYDEGDTCIAARMYASGAPYEETTVIINTTKGRAAIKKPTVGVFEQDVIARDGIGEYHVWTTHSMLSFAHWFAEQPASVRERVVNCSAYGLRIEGIAHAELADVIEQAQRARIGSGGAVVHQPVRSGELAHENQLARRAQAVLMYLESAAEAGLGIIDDGDLLEWARQHSIFGMWTGPERLRMRRRDDLSSAERGQTVAETIRTACKDILRCAGKGGA